MISIDDYILELVGVELYNFLSSYGYAVITRTPKKTIISINPIEFIKNHVYIDELSNRFDKILANIYYTNRENLEKVYAIYFGKILKGMGYNIAKEFPYPMPIEDGILYKNNSFRFLPFIVSSSPKLNYYILIETDFMNRPHIFGLIDSDLKNFYNDAKVVVARCGCDYIMVGITKEGLITFNDSVSEVIRYIWNFTVNPPSCQGCGEPIKFESVLSFQR